MAELYGYTGKILVVDLSTGETSTLNTADYTPFLGGRGIGAKIHWDMVGHEVKGCDPENVVSFMTSPAMGTPIPGGQKTCVTGVAPHMYPKETYLKSVFGGMWGPELKYAGWDGVVLKGASEKPVYLLIRDDKVELRDASDLWGMDTQACQHVLWDRFDDKHRIALIGPAGENLVGDAIILTDDSNTAGKGGFGAVLGSKKLKAIVVRGTGKINVARPQEVLDLAYEAQRIMTRKETEDEPSHAYRGSLFGPISTEGTDLYNEGKKEDGTVRTGISGCMMCPIACGMSIKFKDGEQDAMGHVMCVESTTEMEESAVTGENYGPTAIARLKEMDKLGYSVWAMHNDIWPLFTYGILKPEDLEIDAEVGTREFSKQLIHKISYREGLGDELAKGRAHFLNEFIGTPEAQLMYQMQAVTKGQSRLTYNYGANFYGPIGWLGSCVSRGRDNDQTWPFANTITDPRVVAPRSDAYNQLQMTLAKQLWGSEQAAIDSMSYVMGDFTAPMAYTAHNFKAWTDSVGSCSNFLTHVSMYTDDYMGDWSIRRKMFSAVTGMDIDSDEKENEYCDRIWMLERAIITREGQTKDDDWMFDCIFEDDSYAQLGFNADDLRRGIDQYYEIRGIDVATGIPRRSTLERLGLTDVANRLEGEYQITLPA